MSSRERLCASPPALPRWLRTILLVVTTAILCSCRGPHVASTDPFQDRDRQSMFAATGHETMPGSGVASNRTEMSPSQLLQQPQTPHRSERASHSTGTESGEPPVVLASAVLPLGHGGAAACPPGCPYPTGPAAQYMLPPSDEILCDGGDEGLHAGVLRDGTVAGLELTDAVAHYRTPDGQIVLVPTNDVCIYAPRFGAVRQVSGANVALRSRGVEGMTTDLVLVGTESRFEPSTTKQHLEPASSLGEKPSSLLRGRQQMGGLENEDGISRVVGRDQAFANLQSIRFVLVDNRDQPLDLGGMLNAIHWTHDLGVQVAMDSRKAQVISSNQQAAFLYHIDEPNEPRLKVVKLADRVAAQPGEIVRFQLRYQNIGNRPIGELTLVDNLTTRLEFIEGSEQSDRPAAFAAELNDGGSLILRWQLAEPLEPGESGVITFACRVR